MTSVRSVTWCFVALLFGFENYRASENNNETSWNSENKFFINLSTTQNESDSFSIPNPSPIPIFNGTCDFSTCPETTNYSSRNLRPCKCDKDCVEFRDCCSDSKYYHEKDQRRPLDYECHQIGNFGYFLKRGCSPSWDDGDIRDKCALSMNHFLDIEAIELRSPVTNLRSNITYGNIYCALCNYELDDAVLWNVSIASCDTTIKHPKDLVLNRPKITTSSTIVVLNDYDSVATKKPIQLSFQDLTFHVNSWYYEDETTRYYCSLILVPPSDLEFHYCSKGYVPEIRDCPANWTDKRIADQCRSTNSKVYDWRGKSYRNKYCAYCRGLTDFNITCDVLQLFSGEVVLRKLGFPRTKQQFTILFDFKLKADSKICNETKKSYERIQKKLCPRHLRSHESKPEKYAIWFATALSVYTFIAVLVSLIFLLLHLIIFFVVEELQTISGKNLASFCTALIFAYGSFLLGNFVHDEVCYVTAVLMYYSFLCAFFWMLIISYDMWNTFWKATKKFRSPKNVGKRFVVYSFLVWSTPAILVSTTLYFDLIDDTESVLAPNFGYSGCWFDNELSLLVFFVGPVCAILFVNFALFMHTSYMLRSSRCESVNQKSRVDFKLFTRIGLLTGFTWIIGFVAGYTQNSIVWLVFVVLNTAQGVFIFVAFSCKKRVIRSFLKRINKFEKWQRHLQETNVASNGTTASTPLNDVVSGNTRND